MRDDERYCCISSGIDAHSGSSDNQGRCRCDIVDYGLRRLWSLRLNLDDNELRTEQIAIAWLKIYERHLKKVLQMAAGTGIEPIIGSPPHDITPCVYYPPLEEIQFHDGLQIVLRSELEEMDRLCPNTDLVKYRPAPKIPEKRVIFKYYFLENDMEGIWDEMNILLRLREHNHPNIVPIDRVVVDEFSGRVIGFTLDYAPEEKLHDDDTRVFKLKWLHQLITLVDELNSTFGIVHQSISPRNIIIDGKADCIKLFYFENAAPVNGPKLRADLVDMDDVFFTLYEIITLDGNVRKSAQSPYSTMRERWIQHPDVKLDHPTDDSLRMIDIWCTRGLVRLQEIELLGLPATGNPPKRITWPAMEEPEPEDSNQSRDIDWSQRKNKPVWRQNERESGWFVLNWERPPQKEGVRLLETGEEVADEDAIVERLLARFREMSLEDVLEGE